jgi:hypothetical protein
MTSVSSSFRASSATRLEAAAKAGTPLPWIG